MKCKEIRNFRAASVPLISVDPYFSLWSNCDNLCDDVTRHWTGRRNSISGLISIDDKWYRFMGKVQADNYRSFSEPEIIPQSSCSVEATTTTYTFDNEQIFLSVSFINPFMPNNLELFSAPICYLDYNYCFKDDKEHKVKLYFDICSEVVSNDTREKVVFRKNKNSISCGRLNQDILTKSGDDRLIDWGYLHLSAPGFTYYVVDNFQKRELFRWNNPIKELTEPTEICKEFPSLCAIKEYNNSRAEYGFIVFSYDDIYSIEFMNEKLIPYWKKTKTFDALLEYAIINHNEIKNKCYTFDKKMRADAGNISLKYADLVCLAYRQIMAGHKLVCYNDSMFFMSKECNSNGCIATVDITYPSIPVFLLLNTDLAKAMLEPVFVYANSEKWKYEFAPHDLGTYPLANGQTYIQDCTKVNEKEEDDQMPVEECGNMILCTAAICERDKDYSFAEKHLEILKKWVNYLINIGYDPEDQLCTDDFGGSFAHNCNLSLKLILSVAAFGKILNNLDLDGEYYFSKSKEFSKQWCENAFDTDHYKFTFDKNDTWSLKYNLIWDKYLELGIFNEDVFKTEVSYYKTKINKYGVPLDYRKEYTKSDWQMWTACLTDDIDYRNKIIDCMWDFVNESEPRVPFGDWYETKTPKQIIFQARTVQGGLFMPMLFEAENKDGKIIKKNWKKSLLNAATQKYGADNAINSINKEANELLSNVDIENGLWHDLNWEQSADITISYSRLYSLTLAYSYEGTKYYKSEKLLEFILSSLKWMNENKYGDIELMHKGKLDFWKYNWWDWNIGAPNFLMNTMILLGENMPYLESCVYLKLFDFVVPKPRDFGTNKIDFAKLIIKSCILKGDFGKIPYTISQITHLFEECDFGMNDGQGFYSDGTYIFHGKHAMNGIYGLAFLSSAVELIEFLNGTKYSIDDSILCKIADWYIDGYIPCVNFGSFTRMMLGRAPKTSITRGKAALDLGRRILNLSYNKTIDDFLNGKRTAFAKMYSFGDKAIVGRKGKTYCISMSSSRTYNYECINHENMTGWYVGDGMLTVYTNNNVYAQDYWEKVNPYFIPGTTVDAQKREEVSISKGAYLSNEDFVGGCTLGENLVCSMCLESYHNEENIEENDIGHGGGAPIHHCTLKAKKAWFCFNDEMICLGADISANDGFEVLTTLENTDKVVNIINDMSFSVDGIGYYTILDSKTIKHKKEKDMTISYIEHGVNPKQDNYSYVISDSIEVKSRIIENSGKLQAAIYGEKLGIVFYEAGSFEGISVNIPCIVIKDNNHIAVCDPTWKNDGLTLSLGGKTYDVSLEHGKTSVITLF